MSILLSKSTTVQKATSHSKKFHIPNLHASAQFHVDSFKTLNAEKDTFRIYKLCQGNVLLRGILHLAFSWYKHLHSWRIPSWERQSDRRFARRAFSCEALWTLASCVLGGSACTNLFCKRLVQIPRTGLKIHINNGCVIALRRKQCQGIWNSIAYLWSCFHRN